MKIENIEAFGRFWSLSDEHPSASYGAPVVVDDQGRGYGPVDRVVDKAAVARYADEIAFYGLEAAAKRARTDAGLWTDDDAFDLPRKAKEWAPVEVADLYIKFVALNPNHPFRRGPADRDYRP